jgi:hypothetical protein
MLGGGDDTNQGLRQVIKNMDSQAQQQQYGNRQRNNAMQRRAAAANHPQKVTGLGERGADNFMPKKREQNLVANFHGASGKSSKHEVSSSTGSLDRGPKQAPRGSYRVGVMTASSQPAERSARDTRLTLHSKQANLRMQ